MQQGPTPVKHTRPSGGRNPAAGLGRFSFPAARAAELGLISRAVPVEELDAAVDEVLADLRLGGPGALGAAKRLVYEVPAMEQAEAVAWTTDLSRQLFAGEEAAAGMKAFLKRERPPWAADAE